MFSHHTGFIDTQQLLAFIQSFWAGNLFFKRPVADAFKRQITDSVALPVVPG